MTAETRVRNSLDDCLQATRERSALALVMYLTAGFPDAESTKRWGALLAESGASIIELGVPFSDPIGDGPTIQHASQRALDAGMTLHGSLEIAAAIRKRTTAPIVLMSYCNPVLHMGPERFAAEAAAAGITGAIIPDLPIEEAGEIQEALSRAGMHLIYLLSPASTPDRIAATVAAASGFIYCMALTGVTGARSDLAAELPAFLMRVRALTAVPMIVGFGISKPEHLVQLRGSADGAVVASALVDLVDSVPPEHRDSAIENYVRELSASCSGS